MKHKNSLITALLFCLLTASAAGQGVIINELLAGGGSPKPIGYVLPPSGNVADARAWKDSVDWIELYNSGGAAVSLKNWSLTDDVTAKSKWVFPDVTIGAGQFLLVILDGFQFLDDTPSTSTPFDSSTDRFKKAGHGLVAGDKVYFRNVNMASSKKIFTATTPSTLNCTSHGFAVNDRIVLSVTSRGANDKLPTGLSDSIAYWVVSAPANSLTISFTQGGAAVTFTDTGTGTFSIAKTGLPKEIDPFADHWVVNPTANDFQISDTSGLSPVVNYNDNGNVHAEFCNVKSYFAAKTLNLNAGGEYLGLYNASQAVQSEFTPSYPNQAYKYSYGIHPYDSKFHVLDTPTPGYANTSVAILTGVMKKPQFSYPHGFYNSSFNLSLGVPDQPFANIRYTLDGSQPSESAGTLYSGPITISTTTYVRAIAYYSDFVNSTVETNTYIFIASVLTQSATPTYPGGTFPATWGQFDSNNDGTLDYTCTADYLMDPLIVNQCRNDPRIPINDCYSTEIADDFKKLPTVSVVMNVNDLFDSANGIYSNPLEGESWYALYNANWQTERACSMEFFSADGKEDLHINCGIEIAGGMSKKPDGTNKHNFRLHFSPNFGPSSCSYSFFGPDAVTSFNDLELRGTFNRSWAMKGAATWDHACAMYMEEPWTVGSRAAMGDPAMRERFVHLYLNGLYWGLYRITEQINADFAADYCTPAGRTKNADEWDVVKHTIPVDYTVTVKDGQRASWDQAIALAGNYDLSVQANYQNLLQYIDIDNYVNYILMHMYSGDGDSLQLNGMAQNFYAGCIRNASDPAGVPIQKYKFFEWDAEFSLKGGDTSGPYTAGNNPADFHVRAVGGVFSAYFTADSNTDRLTSISHGLVNNNTITLSTTGTLPTGLNNSTTYYVVNKTLNDFQISLTSGGAAINFTSNGSGNHAFSKTGGWPTQNDYILRFADAVYENMFNDGALTIQYPNTTNTWDALGRAYALLDQVRYPIVCESARWGHSSTPNLDAFMYYPVYGVAASANRPCERNDNWMHHYMWIFTNDDGSTGQLVGRVSVVLAQLQGKTPRLYPAAVGGGGWETNPPNWSQHGGSYTPGSFTLTMTNPNSSGSIYYTTDGSDPRTAFTGAIHGTLYSSGITTLSGEVTVKARVYKSTSDWSPLHQARFYPTNTAADWSKLLITEVMYNPPDVGAVKGDRYEFIELKNTGTATLYMTGVYFSDGIQFAFPKGYTIAAGGFAVIASDQLVFTSKYPSVTVAGEYSGHLNNSGEHIAISKADGTLICEMTYDSKYPWPKYANGNGYSLVPVSYPATNASLSDPAVWRASTYQGGSPGADDPAAVSFTVVVNEAFTHASTPDLTYIELYNYGGSSVNVSYWYLSDDINSPNKYQIPNGTTIPAGGYLVVYETAFNPGGAAYPVAPKFFLNPIGSGTFDIPGGSVDVTAGGGAFVSSANSGGTLTGYQHGFNFGAAATGVSFGRYVNSVGKEFFAAQKTRTPGAENSGPKVGPVVISEINYHPAQSKDEFIELTNIMGSAVNLYNAYGTWKINGMGYSLPSSTSIAASSTIIIAPIAPADFRTKYNISALINIYGPYYGALSNGGEKLELQQPDAPGALPDGSTATPYVNVDEVTYSDNAPWPSLADGIGYSLHRINNDGFGTDPTNWNAGLPFNVTNVPAAPTVLAATAFSNSRIDLSWTDNAVNETGFKIERSIDANGNWVQITTVGANVTAYSDTGLPELSSYFYRVCAYNANGDSPYTNVAGATTPNPYFAESGGTCAWEAEHYHQLVSNGDSRAWAEYNTRAGFYHTGYIDTIDAGAGDSVTWSSACEAVYRVNFSTAGTYYLGMRFLAPSTSSDRVRFGVDGSQRSSGDFSGTQSTWSWKRAASTISMTKTGQHVISVRRYEDGFCIDRLAISTNSNNVPDSTSTSGPAESTNVYITLPNSPTALTAAKDPTKTTSQINLSWTDNATDESGFKIYRSLDNTTFVVVATLTPRSANPVTCTDENLAAGTVYYYRVYSYNMGGNSSAYASASAATDGAPPLAPSGLSATANGNTEIDLVWTDNSNNETGFTVERSLNGMTGWASVASKAANSTSHNDTGLPQGTAYFYRVKATNATGSSAYSNVASATTGGVAIVYNITVSASGTNLQLSFPTVSGKSYRLFKNTATPLIGDAGWTYDNQTVAGDGTTKSFTIVKPASGKVFYTIEYTM